MNKMHLNFQCPINKVNLMILCGNNTPPFSVYFCSCGVLLQWLYTSDLAAPCYGHHGIHRNTVLFHGGEDAEYVS